MLMQYAGTNELVIYQGRLKLIGLLIGALVFVVLGSVFVDVGLTEPDRSITLVAIGAVSLAFFGICFIFLLYRLFNRKPSIVVNDEGIVDNTTYISVGSLKWHEISGISFYEFMGQPFIGIQLHDEDRILSRMSSLQRRLMKMNTGLVKAPVNITQAGLNMPLQELYFVLKARWEQEAARGK